MQAPKTPLEQSLFALLLCLTFANPSAGSTPGEEIPIGKTLPDATLRGLNGPSRQLNSFRGRPLLINVWASWCGPCKQEMASLERLAWQERSFAIIGVSTDDYADKASGLLEATHATISHFIDHDLQMETMLGASHLPLTVLVDADGRVLKKIYGAKQWDAADARHLIDETFHHRTSKSMKAPVPRTASAEYSGAQAPSPLDRGSMRCNSGSRSIH
jgi:thiol-disulfide isomerase/thioredoxin